MAHNYICLSVVVYCVFNSLTIAAVKRYMCSSLTDSYAALPSNKKMPLMAKNKSSVVGSSATGTFL